MCVMTAIRSIRSKLNFSQDALAKALGKTKAAISHYESGRYQMPVSDAKVLIKVAACHGVRISLEDIYADDVEPSHPEVLNEAKQ